MSAPSDEAMIPNSLYQEDAEPVGDDLPDWPWLYGPNKAKFPGECSTVGVAHEWRYVGDYGTFDDGRYRIYKCDKCQHQNFRFRDY